MSDFIHLHNHTEYSLLDGLAKIPLLIARCLENKMSAVAITDHGGMYGVIKFYLACKKAGIKPIIGSEFYVAHRLLSDKQAGLDNDQYHLILLAKNLAGYQNLMKLTTIAHLEGYYYKPRIDLNVLKKYADGLICLTACIEGQIPSLLRHGQDEEAEKIAKEYLTIFPENHFYLELQKHKIEDQDRVNEKMIVLSRKLGIPLVATNDCHYVDKEDAEAQEALLCVGTQNFLTDPKRKISMINSPDFYFRTAREMKTLFLQYPEAINNTVKIAEMCHLEIPMGKLIFPHFSVPKGETAVSYLKKLTYQSLPYRYQKLTSEVKKRVDYELEVISNKGFATYFLIVADFVNWAKEQGIRVGPGRGSAAGSIVAYVMRITSLDPIYHNLPFERFMNPERPSPPDIDLDFADDRRDEVIAYVTEKYGKDKVAQIITFGTMEARQSIRDIGRVMGLAYAVPDRVAKLIPPGAQGFPMTIEKALGMVPELLQLYQTDREIKKMIDLARRVEGVTRHASTHAAGVVIADKPLTEYTPLQTEVKGERIVTQYDMYSLDLNVSGEGKAVGLLKMDFLGLRNLTILEKAMEFVKKLKQVEIDISGIPLDDKKVFKMISSGETTGVFQLESGGMRRLARNLKPNKFSDLAAMVALFRPGPMDWIDDFIISKANAKSIKYPHPDLKAILSETYGIAVYQEQCLQIANVMAGYSMGEADILRRAIGKKKKEIMEQEKEKFIKKAVEKGYKKQIAENVFALIEKFAGYGFNKAHATSYAMIAYQTAYMKAHFPVEFMAAVLAAESSAGTGLLRDEKVALAVEECRRMKIAIFGPDINLSETGFTIEKIPDGQWGIRFGLSAIKNVGQAAIEAILSARQKVGPFTDLFNFCERVDLQKVNKKTLESLIKAGAMDRFNKRSTMLSVLPQMMEEGHKVKKKIEEGQFGLFDDATDKNDLFASLKSIVIPDMEEFSSQELAALEREFLGFYLSEHPGSQALAVMKDLVSHNLGELADKAQLNQKVKIGGLVISVRVIMTKKNNSEMAFVKLADRTGSIELTVFPRIYAQVKNLLLKDQPVLVTGRLDKRERKIGGETEGLIEQLSVIVETVEAVDPNQKVTDFVIKIPQGTSKEKLAQLSNLLKVNPGEGKVVIVLSNGEEEKKITAPFGVMISEELKNRIREIIKVRIDCF